MISNQNINIAMLQFNPFWENTEANLVEIEECLVDLHPSVDLLILPEAFSTGFSMNAAIVAEAMNGQTVTWLKRIALEKNIAICGSIFISENHNFYNRFIWVFPNGELLTYDKRHLFSIGAENECYTRGNSQLIISYKDWQIFPQICYDLRFPVWSRNVMGYDLLINVANWPGSRRYVWETLLKARAIENQCFVVAVNRTGIDGNAIDYSGNSIVVDYKGEILISLDKRVGLEHINLNKEDLLNFKAKFDTLIDGDQFRLQI